MELTQLRWVSRYGLLVTLLAGGASALEEPVPTNALPEALKEAIEASGSPPGHDAVPKDPFGELPPAFQRSVRGMLEIRGDDDLQSRAGIDVLDALLDHGRLDEAMELAGRIPGFRGAVAHAMVATKAARDGDMAKFRRAYAEAERLHEHHVRTRRGQVIEGHLAGALMAAGNYEAAEAMVAKIDLADQKHLAEAICTKERALREDGLSIDLRNWEDDKNILRPAFLHKADTYLTIAEHSLDKHPDPKFNPRRVELLELALEWATRSRVNLAATRARAAESFARMGMQERADGLHEKAVASLSDRPGAAPVAIDVLVAVSEKGLRENNTDEARVQLERMRVAIPSVPVTLRAKAAARAADFAFRAGLPAQAEEILREEMGRSLPNPNPRIAALAKCYANLCYARRKLDPPADL